MHGSHLRVEVKCSTSGHAETDLLCCWKDRPIYIIIKGICLSNWLWAYKQLKWEHSKQKWIARPLLRKYSRWCRELYPWTKYLNVCTVDQICWQKEFFNVLLMSMKKTNPKENSKLQFEQRKDALLAIRRVWNIRSIKWIIKHVGSNHGWRQGGWEDWGGWGWGGRLGNDKLVGETFSSPSPTREV